MNKTDYKSLYREALIADAKQAKGKPPIARPGEGIIDPLLDPAPEPKQESKPEYRDVNGVLYERAPDGSWVKAK